MTARTRMTVFVVVLAAMMLAILGAVTLFRGAGFRGAAGGGDGEGPTPRASGELLSELARSHVAIASPDDLAKFLGEAQRQSMSPEIKADGASVDRALEHVSQAVWNAFFQADAEAYRAWRLSNGYEGPSEDRAANMLLRRQAGLKPDAPSPQDWFAAITAHRGSSFEPPTGFSDVRYATLVVVGTLREPIPVDPELGHVRPFLSLLRDGISDEVTSGLAPQQSGSGWPFWFPPQHVLERISKPGTRLIEVRIVPVVSKSGKAGGDVSAAALSFVLARDPKTDTWWIVQFYVYDVFAPSTGNLNGHLL